MTIMNKENVTLQTEDETCVNEEYESEIESNADDTDSNKESDGDDSDVNTGNTNAGWVDSISKILKTNKPKGKKTLVLSKAKKLTDLKEKPKPAGFEVQTEDGKVKEEQIDPLEKLVEKLKSEEPRRKKKRELLDFRVKPNILEKDRERTLAKIATKGVVQLFNAVRTQQKDIDKKLQEAGPLEVKRDKVLKNIDKRAFLDVLMGEKSQNVDEAAKAPQKVNKTEPTWSVLRDDFMMGAKLKDWDKELEKELETEDMELE